MTLGVALLLFLLMAIKVKEHLSNLFIILILLFFCLGSSYLIFKDSFLYQNIFVLTFVNAIPVLLGSLTFLYIYYSIYNEKMFNLWHLLLILPFVVSLFFSYWELTRYILWINLIFNIGAKIIWNILVLSYSLYFLKQSEKQIPTSMLSNIKWLNQFVKIELLGFVFYLLIIFLWLFNIQSIQNIDVYTNLCVALFVFPIGFIGVKNNETFRKNKHANTSVVNKLMLKNQSDDSIRYKNLLTDEKVESIFFTLLQLVHEKKPYLDENLSIELLSSLLNIHTKYLSYVINRKTNKSFNDFINGYRVRHFDMLIDQNEHKNKTILALAYDSGFASKSSFNRIYKNATGLTPSQYVKNRT